MKLVARLCGLALLVSAVPAHAHVHLQKSIPADGSVITASPVTIVLSFSEPARLTALWIQKGTEEKRKLGPLPTEPARQISVAAPQLAPGAYVVSWRLVSADGHIMSGTTHFTLSQASAADHPAQH